MSMLDNAIKASGKFMAEHHAITAGVVSAGVIVANAAFGHPLDTTGEYIGGKGAEMLNSGKEFFTSRKSKNNDSSAEQ